MTKGFSLEFWGGKLGFADGTGVEGMTLADLEGVGVNQGNEGGATDEDIGFVDIADDVTPRMDAADGGSEIAGRAIEVLVVEEGTAIAPGFGGVEVVEGEAFTDAGHEKADNSPSLPEGIENPGNGDMAGSGGGIVGGVGRHDRQFARQLWGWVMIEFGDPVGMLVDTVDFAFATAGDCCTQTEEGTVRLPLNLHRFVGLGVSGGWGDRPR